MNFRLVAVLEEFRLAVVLHTRPHTGCGLGGSGRWGAGLGWPAYPPSSIMRDMMSRAGDESGPHANDLCGQRFGCVSCPCVHQLAPFREEGCSEVMPLDAL